MEKFYLEKPSIKRKKEAIEYIQEHLDNNSNINGTGGLDHVLDGKYTYEEWLEELEKRKDKDYAYSINRVPGETFFFVREDDDKIVGMINIRHDLTEEMLQFGGHIGYGIRPSERRKGYNKINLYLGLQIAKKMGLEEVMLDCAIDNIGSDKTIQALGGVLERCEFDPADSTMTNVYWINVEEALKQNLKEYQSKIK